MYICLNHVHICFILIRQFFFENNILALSKFLSNINTCILQNINVIREQKVILKLFFLFLHLIYFFVCL